MALAGHDTASLVFNVTSTGTVRSGTLTGVVAGELVVVVLAIDGNTNTQDPSAYTVTLGSDTLSHIVSNTTTLNEGFSAIFSGVATASGDQTLSVTTPNSTRAMKCHAFRITGFDTTTPHPKSGQTKPGSNATSLTSPNGVTTAADGNAIIGGISVHGGDITNLAVGAADGSTTGSTGTDAFSDCTWGVAWDRTPTAASVTFAWTWTTSDRPGAAWVEVAEAAGGGTPATATPGAGAVTVQGQAPGASAAASAVPGAGAIAVQGYAPTASAGGAVSATPGAGSVVVQGNAPAVAAAATASPGAGSVSVQGHSPVPYIPAANDLTWNGFQLTWSGEQVTWTPGTAAAASPGAGSVAVQGHPPTVSVGGSASANPGTGSVTVHGHAPTVSIGVSVTCGSGSVTVQGRAPTASAGGAVSAAPGTGLVIVQGHAPDASIGASAASGAGAVTVQGHAPAVSAGVTITVGSGSVAVQGRAPTAFTGAAATRRFALAGESRTGAAVLNPANGAALLKAANGT